jgi:superkiller protein 3
MTLPTVDEVIDADRSTLKHYCELYGLSAKGKNRLLRARLFELIRLGETKEHTDDEIETPHGLSRFRRALLLASKGEARRALDELDKCLEACPESGLSLIAKSLLLGILDEEGAVSCSEEAVAIDDRVEVLLGRALVLLGAGRWSDAEDAAGSLTDGSEDPVPWLLKAFATIPAGRAGLAVQYLDEALEIDDQIPELWNMKGEIVVRLGNYGNSLPCFDQAINLRPDYSEAHNNKGVALLHLHHYEDALECFEEALGFMPEYPEAMANKAIALHMLGNGEDSLRWIDMAAELQPSAELWNNKGHILLSMERYEEAMLSFGTALDIDEDFVEARRGKEMALVKLEEKRKEDEALAQPTDVRKFLEAGETGST